MFDAARLCEDHQVFTFTGHVEADDRADPSLSRGYALANDPASVIATMRDYGFEVTAMSSLADLRETMMLLNAIRRRDPEIEQDSEYLKTDGMAAFHGIYPPTSVFTFMGKARSSTTLSAGFIVAESDEALVACLGAYQYTVVAFSSLQDLEHITAELHAVACGQGSNCIDLIGVTAEAA
ncbi:MAG: hypothetical protein EPN79_15940 [Burkholderiaceae bacterium]|nr:MAG: hypothetical protein EPN79_15940 [Burkholderiaceae bacterium]